MIDVKTIQNTKRRAQPYTARVQWEGNIGEAGLVGGCSTGSHTFRCSKNNGPKGQLQLHETHKLHQSEQPQHIHATENLWRDCSPIAVIVFGAQCVTVRRSQMVGEANCSKLFHATVFKNTIYTQIEDGITKAPFSYNRGESMHLL